jgi:replicative DNA helicase
MATANQQLTGIPSKFERVGDMTGGFQPSELILVAARSAMGNGRTGTVELALVEKCARFAALENICHYKFQPILSLVYLRAVVLYGKYESN